MKMERSESPPERFGRDGVSGFSCRTGRFSSPREVASCPEMCPCAGAARCRGRGPTIARHEQRLRAEPAPFGEILLCEGARVDRFRTFGVRPGRGTPSIQCECNQLTCEDCLHRQLKPSKSHPSAWPNRRTSRPPCEDRWSPRCVSVAALKSSQWLLERRIPLDSILNLSLAMSLFARTLSLTQVTQKRLAQPS